MYDLIIYNGNAAPLCSYELPANFKENDLNVPHLKQTLNMLTDGDSARDLVLKHFNEGRFVVRNVDEGNFICLQGDGMSKPQPTPLETLPSGLDDDTFRIATAAKILKQSKAELAEMKDEYSSLEEEIQSLIDRFEKELPKQIEQKEQEVAEAAAAFQELVTAFVGA